MKITEKGGCDEGAISECVINGLERCRVGVIETSEVRDCNRYVEIDGYSLRKRLGGGGD